MFINAHTHKVKQEKDVISVYSTLPDPFPDKNPSRWLISAGIHPWMTGDKDFSEMCSSLESLPAPSAINWKPIKENAIKHWQNKLEALARKRQIVAIGEIGLDRAHDKQIDSQLEIFKTQLQLAEENRLPVIIHCVRAYPELLNIRKEFNKTPWIIHGFTTNKQIAAQLVKKNCYLSFGEAVINRKDVMEVLKSVPLNRILLETDESQYDIKRIYSHVAEILSINLGTLQMAVLKNFKTIYFGET